MAERYGQTQRARPHGPLIWLHGASVGEIIAAMALIERVHRRGVGILVTSGTVTSAELAAQRLPADAIHQFMPLDVPRFVAAFSIIGGRTWRCSWSPISGRISFWRPSSTAIPLILLNGRLSERSFRHWRRVPRTIAALLQKFELCLAQSQDDGRRYAAIGAAVNITGNLKIDMPPPPADAGRPARAQDADRQPCRCLRRLRPILARRGA